MRRICCRFGLFLPVFFIIITCLDDCLIVWLIGWLTDWFLITKVTHHCRQLGKFKQINTRTLATVGQKLLDKLQFRGPINHSKEVAVWLGGAVLAWGSATDTPATLGKHHNPL